MTKQAAVAPRPGAGHAAIRLRAAIFALLFLLGAAFAGAAFAQSSQPRTITFPSADGKTTLVGYLFAPAGRPKTAPAVVLMHGRTGAYSSLARGNYSSVTLEKRIRSWAELWAQQGYWALVVDSFGPRGYPQGYNVGTAAGKPAAAGEARVWPLDAYAALRYLRSSPRVKGDRIALQGWSNGGTATLAAMSRDDLPEAETKSGHAFRIALAMYPNCTSQERLKDDYQPYAPVHIFVGARDDETSSAACVQLAAAAHQAGGEVAVTVLPGATHDFDQSAGERQQLAANVAAAVETRKQAIALLTAALR
ncbi:MAG: dienelactone hydrolase family protein [Devosia sp.]|nr:dienelactone hydrolase family protein [Devosia sp.]